MARNRFFGLTNRLLLLVAALLLVISYLSMVVNPAKLWLMSIAGLMFVPFLLLNIFLLFWAFVRRSKAFVIPLLAIIPALFFMGRYAHFTGDDEPPTVFPERVLKVMTWNVGRFALHNPSAGVKGFDQCADSVFAYIREQKPDIVCLQEFKIKDARRIRQYLKTKMPGYFSEYYVFTDKNGSAGNHLISCRILFLSILDIQKSGTEVLSESSVPPVSKILPNRNYGRVTSSISVQRTGLLPTSAQLSLLFTE